MGETDAQILSELVQGAKTELEVVKRQSMVYSLYARRQKSIMVSFSASQSALLFSNTWASCTCFCEKSMQLQVYAASAVRRIGQFHLCVCMCH